MVLTSIHAIERNALIKKYVMLCYEVFIWWLFCRHSRESRWTGVLSCLVERTSSIIFMEVFFNCRSYYIDNSSNWVSCCWKSISVRQSVVPALYSTFHVVSAFSRLLVMSCPVLSIVRARQYSWRGCQFSIILHRQFIQLGVLLLKEHITLQLHCKVVDCVDYTTSIIFLMSVLKNRQKENISLFDKVPALLIAYSRLFNLSCYSTLSTNVSNSRCNNKD